MQNAAVFSPSFCLAATASPRGARGRGLPCLRRWLQAALIFALLHAFGSQAWDAQRMLAAAQRQGANAVQGTRELQALLVSLARSEAGAQLQAVNQFFNQHIFFREDIEVWGQIDYWASPMEMLEKGQGDCEDYAIGKYFSLLALGVPVNKLRLVYVRAQLAGPGSAAVAHMVLAYYASAGADPMILDNLVAEVLPASHRGDLSPVFSFNSEGLWQGVGTQAAGDPTARLSRWRDLLAKVRQEGFQ